MKLLELNENYYDKNIVENLCAKLKLIDEVEVRDSVHEGIEEMVLLYKTCPDLIYFFSNQELEILEAIYDKEKGYLQLKSEFPYLMQLLQMKYVIYDTGESYVIFDELLDVVESLISGIDDYRREKYIQELTVGLCNAYGVIEKQFFLQTIKRIVGDITFKEIEEILVRTHYFFNQLRVYKDHEEHEDLEFYCYPDLEMVHKFMEYYGDFVDIPENKLDYSTLKEYSTYKIAYSEPVLQDFIARLRLYCDDLNEVKLAHLILKTTNSLKETTLLKLYIYEIFNHSKSSGKLFFNLLDKLEQVLAELPSWKTKAYNLEQMRKIVFDMKEEMFSALQNQMDDVGREISSNNFKAFMDFMDHLDDDIDDIFDDEDNNEELN